MNANTQAKGEAGKILYEWNRQTKSRNISNFRHANFSDVMISTGFFKENIRTANFYLTVKLN